MEQLTATNTELQNKLKAATAKWAEQIGQDSNSCYFAFYKFVPHRIYCIDMYYIDYA